MAYYFIKSEMCDYVLDVEGEGGSGSRVLTYDKHGKSNQIWYDDPATGTIRTKSNKKCCLTFDGEQLIIKKYEAGNPHQQWMRQGKAIRNRVETNQVIDIYRANKELGATVGMYKYKGRENQHWEFIPVPGQMEGISSPYFQGEKKQFYIVSEMHGKVLDICEENLNIGAYVIVWAKQDTPKPNQLWYLDNLGLIRSSLSDLAIYNAEKGQKLVTAMPSADPRTQWLVQGDQVMSRTGEVMDISGEDKSDGAKVISYDSNGQTNQKWRVEYI